MLYPNADAADPGRGEDAQPIKGLGDQAYASVRSVWVYVGEISFFTQWYSFDGTDDENLERARPSRKRSPTSCDLEPVSAGRDGVAGDRARDHLPPGPAVAHR